MAINYEQALAYLAQARTVERTLEANGELFDREKLDEFRQVTAALEQNIQIARQQSRKLSIGIVGAVKAGKSSFLNALLFDGKEFLPKAATPMTAALTKITYSETPKAQVHFYTKEDWDRVKADSERYDAGLKADYGDYCERVAAQAQFQSQSPYVTPLLPMSIEDFERTQYNPSEIQRGAKELTRMVKDPAILDKLDSADTLEGDIMGKLNDYVGAGGIYTPIVSYVELQSDSPCVKDYEIVDTPGLNDPVVSRGIVTKQFLRSCDVVLLLSPCSQFMDSQTITLMANSLPNAGVREVIVIGSKLDSGILNESDRDFPTAYKKSVDSYRLQFQNSLTRVKGGGKGRELVNKISQASDSPMFISSTCFSIARKQGAGEALDEHEAWVLDNLKKQFSGFDETLLRSIGGIGKVHKALNKVSERKAEIIEGKNDAVLDDARRGHLRVLDRILQEVVSSRTKLETVSADELRQKIANIRNVIDTSRERLAHLFEGAAIQCDAKVQQLLPQLTLEKRHHRDIEIKTKTRTEHKSVRGGLFGWRKDTISFEVTNHGASVSDVSQNIEEYAAKCLTYVDGEFQHIFNKEQFSHNIIDVVLEAFRKGGREFDEDDIRLPLQNVLSKISIAHMELDYTPYIDELETHFNKGYAGNEEIHQLESLQTRLLDNIEQVMTEQLKDALKDISKTLKDQGVHFADDIEGKLCGELEKLQGQVDEREKYIAGYVRFAEETRGLKMTLSGL